MCNLLGFSRRCRSREFRRSADVKDIGGVAYFDAMHLTQSKRAAVNLGRLGFAVLPVDKVAATWGKIKAQY